MADEVTQNVFALSFPNDMAGLQQVTQGVSSFIEEHDVPPKAGFAIELSLEEAVTNVIKYGYDDNAPHLVSVRLVLGPAAAYLRIEDDGHEFDPLKAPKPDVTRSLDESTPGGLGLHLVRNLAEAVHYHRENGKNLLEIRIALQSE